MSSQCMACRWRSPALTCSLHLIAGPVGQSVLWCSHVEQCRHEVVRGYVEQLLQIKSRVGRAERISEIEREAGRVVAADVRDAFAVAFGAQRGAA